MNAVAETVWIWSDLHLGDQVILAAGARPFSTAEEMDGHLLEAWGRAVGTEDLIVAWAMSRTPRPGATRPPSRPSGTAPAGGSSSSAITTSRTSSSSAAPASSTSTWPCSAPPTRPFALTHVPLRRVPPTAMNVHGHLHGAPAPAGRYVNVSVERIGYAPVRLDAVLEEAAQRQ